MADNIRREPDDLSEFFLRIANGTSEFSFRDLRLEGLHYVHISNSERYEFIYDGVRYDAATIKVPADDTQPDEQFMNEHNPHLDVNAVGYRYRAGLLIADSTRIFITVRNRIVQLLSPNSTVGENGIGGNAPDPIKLYAAKSA